MASFGGVGKEAITFVLSGDASNLIQTFGDVEKAADKTLKKAEGIGEKIGASLTKVGAISVGAGLGAALGLTGAIKDAEEADRAVDQLSTTIEGMGSSIDVADIQSFAFDLQQVTQFTDEQVVAAARWGATFDLTTDQLKQLLTVAADLATQTGKSLDSVTKALARAATGGGAKPLEKILGFKLDPDALEADAWVATIDAAMSQAGGAAKKGADTFTGQMDRIGKNWDNIKEDIGRGANEVFEPIASAVGDLTENLATANPELLRTAGHFSAIGSIGATVFGGLATAGGQIANLRDGFGGLGDKLRTAEGDLTRFGGVLKGLGTAGLAVGIGAALAEAAFGIGNSWNDIEQRTKDGVAGVEAAVQSGTSGAGMFAGLVETKDAELKWSHLWTDFGDTAKVGAAGITRSVADIQDAFDELSPKAAIATATEEIVFANERLAEAKGKVAGASKDANTELRIGASMFGGAGNTNDEVTANNDLANAKADVATYTKELTDAEKAYADALKASKANKQGQKDLENEARINKEVAESITLSGKALDEQVGIFGLFSGAQSRLTVSSEGLNAELQSQYDNLVRTSSAAEVYTSALKQMTTATDVWDAGLAIAGAGAKRLTQTFEQIDTDELLTGAIAVGDAFTEMFDDTGVDEAIKPLVNDLPKAFDFATAAADGYTDSQEKAFDGLVKVGDAIKKSGADILTQTNNQELAAHVMGTQADALKNELIPAFEKAGSTTEEANAQADEYLKTLGLTPDQIKTVIELSQAEAAETKLGLLTAQIEKLPPNIQMQVTQQILAGDPVAALAIVQQYVTEHPPVVPTSVAPPTPEELGAVATGSASTISSMMPPTPVKLAPPDPATSGAAATASASAVSSMMPAVPLKFDAPTEEPSGFQTFLGKIKTGFSSTPKPVLDFDTSSANSKADESKKKFDAFGLLKPTATLGATDNATPIVNTAIRKVDEFDGKNATATISVVTRGTAIPSSPGGFDNNPATPWPVMATTMAAPSTTNVYVTMPAGSSGRDVERTMRRHASRNGTRRR